MNYGELLLSKIVDHNAPEIIKNYDIREHHFQTKVEKEAYRFINDYIETNHRCPDYRTLVSSVSGDFTWHPSVKDSFEYLAVQLKDFSAKVKSADFIQNEMIAKFKELKGVDFLDWATKELETIKEDATIKKGVGENLSTLKDKFKQEYLDRKTGKKSKLWATPFDSLTEATSGWSSSDVYGIMGESGRGKSYLSIMIIHSLLKQGATVLIKSFEMKSFLWLSRLFSIISAEEQTVFSDRYNRYVGLENRQILSARLDDDQEELLFKMIDKIESYYPGTLHLQCKGDLDLTRSLDDLDRELQQHPEIDAVFLDPFYGLTDVYGRNANKTAGGAAELAANRFEQLCGIHDVVGFYTVQATIEKSKKSEDGTRELKLPTRDQVKTTKRLLDICSMLISWDSVESMARLGIEKGRNGSEGFEMELIALLDVGVIKEPPKGEEVADMVDTDMF